MHYACIFPIKINDKKIIKIILVPLFFCFRHKPAINHYLSIAKEKNY